MSTSRVAMAAFLFVGLAGVYQDRRYRRIGNLWIAGALALSLALLLFLLLNTLLGSRGLTWLGLGVYYLPGAYFGRWALHLALTCAAALVLWYARVWPAGDAKLYIALSALLVLADPNLPGFPGHLFLILLVNTFVAAGLFLLALTLHDGVRDLPALAQRDLGQEIQAWMKTQVTRWRDEWTRTKVRKFRILIMVWNTLALFLLFAVARRLLALPPHSVLGSLALYLGLTVAWEKVGRFFARSDVGAATLFLVTVLLAPLSIVLHWDLPRGCLEALRMTVGFGLFLGSVRGLWVAYLERTRKQLVSPEALETGMILAPEAWERVDRAGAAPGDRMVRYADGLSGPEAAEVRARLAGAAEALPVYRPRAFAFWVMFGCLWTLCARRNLAQCLVALLPLR